MNCQLRRSEPSKPVLLFRMQRDERRRKTLMKQKVTFKPENSPSHFKRASYYLKQLRDKGDYRNCDIELVTDGGSENVHSAIAAAHCSKVAKLLEVRDVPLRIDVRGFRSESVSKVVEWMYSGEISLYKSQMEEQMCVTNYLGVVFLHHLLENTLKSMADEPKTRIDSLNIATNPRTGVSHETMTYILRVFHENHATLSSDEIKLFQPWAIRTLVSAPAKTTTKIPLINIALSWLRDPQNTCHLEHIASSVSIQDMNIRELNAFQRTLRAVLLNPSTRRLVTVSIEKSGVISINMDRNNYIRHAGETVLRTENENTVNTHSEASVASPKESNFSPLLMHERNREFSKFSMKDLPSYSYQSSPRKTSPGSKEYDDSQSDSIEGSDAHPVSASESLAQELAGLPPTERVFGSGSQQHSKPIYEIGQGSQISGSNSPYRVQGNYSPMIHEETRFSHGAPIRQEFSTPCCLPKSPISFPTNRDRRLHYTNSEIAELQSYPDDVFTKTKRNSQVARYTSSELEELANYPSDVFLKSNIPTSLPNLTMAATAENPKDGQKIEVTFVFPLSTLINPV
ncbi:hypothetical protein Y032_0336g2887 [Ancylostoma ceylanicum]|uniref:BTB domain-containing protein n=1 Tax=Ancylostoma ceylanicum TaxID=53326 RepID=A0A016RZJ3_9BILA|nr:hypothetical protein Y032_0336g2887 [Ancylostoma ceylanicum]